MTESETRLVVRPPEEKVLGDIFKHPDIVKRAKRFESKFSTPDEGYGLIFEQSKKIIDKFGNYQCGDAIFGPSFETPPGLIWVKGELVEISVFTGYKKEEIAVTAKVFNPDKHQLTVPMLFSSHIDEDGIVKTKDAHLKLLENDKIRSALGLLSLIENAFASETVELTSQKERKPWPVPLVLEDVFWSSEIVENCTDRAEEFSSIKQGSTLCLTEAKNIIDNFGEEKDGIGAKYFRTKSVRVVVDWQKIELMVDANEKKDNFHILAKIVGAHDNNIPILFSVSSEPKLMAEREWTKKVTKQEVKQALGLLIFIKESLEKKQ